MPTCSHQPFQGDGCNSTAFSYGLERILQRHSSSVRQSWYHTLRILSCFVPHACTCSRGRQEVVARAGAIPRASWQHRGRGCRSVRPPELCAKLHAPLAVSQPVFQWYDTQEMRLFPPWPIGIRILSCPTRVCEKRTKRFWALARAC